MMALGIDLGGTRIKVGLVDGGTIVASGSLPNRSIPGDLDALAAEVRSLADGRSVHAVGIAVPGVVRPDDRGMSLAAAKYAYLEAMDLVAWSQSVFGVPAVVENDARAALVGEVETGCAQGYDDVVMVILGTGIGTAAIMGGRPVRGHSGHAGILGGHQTISLDGPTCPCGNVGCGESLAATWNVGDVVARARRALATEHPADEAADSTGPLVTGPLATGPLAAEPAGPGAPVPGPSAAGPCVPDLAADGWRGVFDAAGTDPVARAAAAEAVRVWAAVTASMVLAYDPELVVLSGGVLRAPERIVPAVRVYLDHHLWGSLPRPRLVVAPDPELSVVLGMAALASSAMTRTSAMTPTSTTTPTRRPTPTLEH